MQHEEKKGIGCGLFLVLVGLGLLAERLGWIPFDVAWFWPAVLIAIGGSMVYRATRR